MYITCIKYELHYNVRFQNYNNFLHWFKIIKLILPINLFLIIKKSPISLYIIQTTIYAHNHQILKAVS